MTGGRWGPFWDKLVFSKIRERVGGEVKYMTTGVCVLRDERVKAQRKACVCAHMLGCTRATTAGQCVLGSGSVWASARQDFERR
jgi:hypothetical protein